MGSSRLLRLLLGVEGGGLPARLGAHRPPGVGGGGRGAVSHLSLLRSSAARVPPRGSSRATWAGPSSAATAARSSPASAGGSGAERRPPPRRRPARPTTAGSAPSPPATAPASRPGPLRPGTDWQGDRDEVLGRRPEFKRAGPGRSCGRRERPRAAEKRWRPARLLLLRRQTGPVRRRSSGDPGLLPAAAALGLGARLEPPRRPTQHHPG